MNTRMQLVTLESRVLFPEHIDRESTSSSETGLISSLSPVGKAFLGHVAEEIVEVSTPLGKKQFQLLSITRS